MKHIAIDPELVGYCGLYCGACGSYRRDKCPGCHKNHKASWCKVRLCCVGEGYSSCAECTQHADPKDCGLFNNFFSKLFGLLFRSDRAACVRQIKRLGVEGHAEKMAESGRQTIKK